MWSRVRKYGNPPDMADCTGPQDMCSKHPPVVLSKLKIKKEQPEPLRTIIHNSQSRGAYFSVNVLIPTNDEPRGAGEALTHWGSWLTQALLLNLASGERRQS